MSSDLLQPSDSAFVWIWLPGALEPVVAGRIDLVGGVHEFAYGRSYLGNPAAIPIFLPELPLKRGAQAPKAPHRIAGCLRDAAPDNWGRRVILNRLTGQGGAGLDVDRLDELNYLLLSGSDRLGALDFQASATNYVPRLAEDVRLETLMQAAALVEAGASLPLELDEALRHGTSIGGARPKAQILRGKTKCIAKFSASRDLHNVVKGEWIAMRLASATGLNVAKVSLVQADGKDVLLVERFDREPAGQGWHRRLVVSALTILGLTEDQARYASYADLAVHLRHRSSNPAQDLRELFGRMVFNILVGNTDDHARNHATFWDGAHLDLTPAFDIDPRPRLSREANQAMILGDGMRQSRLEPALSVAPAFGLTRDDAERVAGRQIEAIRDLFPHLAAEAGLTETDRAALSGRSILRDYVFDGLQGPLNRFAPK